MPCPIRPSPMNPIFAMLNTPFSMTSAGQHDARARRSSVVHDPTQCDGVFHREAEYGTGVNPLACRDPAPC